MSKLKQAIDSLSQTNVKLFGGLYSHRTFNYYNARRDEVDVVISALIGRTFHAFTLAIMPVEQDSPFGLYDVEVRYSESMSDSAIVPTDALLDFLFDAKIIINNEGSQLSFIYTANT